MAKASSSPSWKKIFVFLGLLSLIALGSFTLQSPIVGPRDTTETPDSKVAEPRPPVPIEERFPEVLRSRTTLYEALRELGMESSAILEMVQATKPVLDLGRLAAGTRFSTSRTGRDPQGEISGLEFYLSPLETLTIQKSNGMWLAEKQIRQTESRPVTFLGGVTTHLWDSARQAEMDPKLILQLAEIFAWQVDFAREVRQGDRWRLTVEQLIADGEIIGWGDILAAEYINAGKVHSAVLFQTEERSLGYFAPDGSSLKRMFLKSPIEFGRISSQFQRRRFHPILKVHRPHLGVDYAARTGTPIRAVGAGTVEMAKWNGGGGRTVRIRHNSMYKTHYLHMKAFARGIRPGTKVEQGQVIGYVGSSGLATGPHLHFEFFKNGRDVDPLREEFPTADPVPQEMLPQFLEVSSQRLALLPSWDGLPHSSEVAAHRSPSNESVGLDTNEESAR